MKIKCNVFIKYQPKDNRYRRWLLCLYIFLMCLHTDAATLDRHISSISDTLQNDTACIFTEKVLFPKSSAVISPDFAGNSVHIDAIRHFFLRVDTLKYLRIKITGSYSPEGSYDFNTRLARSRAFALAEIVKKANPHIEEPIISIVHPTGKEKNKFTQQRSAKLWAVYRSYPNKTSLKGTVILKNDTISSRDTLLSVVAGSVTDIGNPVIDPVGNKHLRVTCSGLFDRLFLTTNLLYDVALTPNIGVGVSVTDRITVLADWMYARWNNRDKRYYWRIYGGDMEARYRIGNRRRHSPLGGHHIGAYCSMACYDFQAGRSHKGVLSDKWNYAVGMSYTYSMPIATRFNIDFSLGMGYLRGTYKKHRPIDDHDVWLSTHKLKWFGPTRAGISLVWLLGDTTANRRKGGHK